MSREIAVDRYPDAEPVKGSMEIRDLPDTLEERDAAGVPRNH